MHDKKGASGEGRGYFALDDERRFRFFPRRLVNVKGLVKKSVASLL